MKKLLVLGALVGLSVSAYAQSILSTNITAGSGLHLITTNRAVVYAIEVSSTNSYRYDFYDNDSITPTSGATPGWYATNVVTGSYVSRSSYPTSYVQTYVSPNNFTNWYTNRGTWSILTTNSAATNTYPPTATVTTAGTETRVSYITATFARGIVLATTGNGSITIYYRNE